MYRAGRAAVGGRLTGGLPLPVEQDLHVLFGVYRAGRAARGGRFAGGLPLLVYFLLFNEIYMFGLVCTGLDEPRRAAGRGRLTGGLHLPALSLLFNEIYMFGLVCTGLDELLDGVASLEDYICQPSPCYLTRSTCLVWCVQGWTGSSHWRIPPSVHSLLFNEIFMFGLVCRMGSPHWRITSVSALLVI